MKVKIKISTPKGMASNTLAKLKGVLGIGKGKSTYTAYCNKADDTMYLEVEGSIKSCFNIISNVNKFNKLAEIVIQNKIIKYSAVKLGATQEQMEQLKDMFSNNTKIEIVKQATAEEIVENNKSLWTTIKEKFTKVK